MPTPLSKKDDSFCLHYPSPYGDVRLAGTSSFVTELKLLPRRQRRNKTLPIWSKYPPLAKVVWQQFEEYFSDARRTFDLPLNLEGTNFQIAVWNYLMSIPFGQTRSYSDVARGIGSPLACRAVGGANHNNQFPIVVPCHRVIGQSGQLVGFGAGLPWKKALLKHEGLSF